MKRLRVLLASAVVLGVSAPAWATSAACTSFAAGTGASPPTFSNIVGCAIDTIAPYSLLVSVLTLVVPLLVVVWGIKGGFRLIGGLFMRGFRAIGSH